MSAIVIELITRELQVIVLEHVELVLPLVCVPFIARLVNLHPDLWQPKLIEPQPLCP
jgi:hypothetical protein